MDCKRREDKTGCHLDRQEEEEARECTSVGSTWAMDYRDILVCGKLVQGQVSHTLELAPACWSDLESV